MIYTWAEFKQNILQLHRLSIAYGDNWEFIEHNAELGYSYLRKHDKVLVNLDGTLKRNATATKDLEDHISVDINEDDSATACRPFDGAGTTILQYEYHVLYQSSYGVPLLCFNAYKPDGSMLTITEAWQIFNRDYASHGAVQHLGSVLTEMDHPILFKPFLTLHPCRTAELLAALPESTNRVITFLSSIGPAVNLRLNLRYGHDA